MPWDVRFAIPNRPGAAVRCLDILAQRGINVEGVSGDLRPGEPWGYIHILVEEAPPVLEAFEDAGIDVHDVHEVTVVDAENRPGALAEVLRPYNDSEDNLEVLYIASGGRVVLGTESMRKPRFGGRVGSAAYFEKNGPAG